MSFILDAIRKSEAERQRSKQPDVYSLQNAGASSARPASAWARALLLLLAIALIVLLVGWLWPQLSTQFKSMQEHSAAAAGGASAQGTSPMQAPAGQATALQAGALPADTAPLSEADAVIQSTGSAGERVFASDDPLPPRHLVKELWELPADYQSTVPDLKFSFHVFSPNPDKRTIIINGRRLREGQMITSQMRLRVITETGVICHHRGRFFHVDVVEKW